MTGPVLEVASEGAAVMHSIHKHINNYYIKYLQRVTVLQVDVHMQV